MARRTGALYWRLSSFYLFYYASVGVLVPFWALYLRDIGLDAVQIGQVTAILLATKIFAPGLWAWLVDRRGRRMPGVRLGSLAALVCFAGVFAGDGFLWLALVMAVFSFFWNATLPQFEATTLDHLGNDAHRYSLIRLWGSFGFILAVVGLGALFDAFGRGSMPTVLLLLMLLIWLSSLLVPDAGADHEAGAPVSLRSVVRRPAVLALLATCLLMQASHGAYYGFFSIHLDDAGYSQRLIGAMWALGVVAEISVFLVAHRLLRRFGARSLLMLSMAVTALRWALVGLFVDSIWILTLTQMMHAASFGTYHAAAMFLFHRHFRGRHQGQGQALYSSVSFGVGGALGSVAAGYAWAPLGASPTFMLAGLVALAGLLVSWRWLRD